MGETDTSPNNQSATQLSSCEDQSIAVKTQGWETCFLPGNEGSLFDQGQPWNKQLIFQSYSTALPKNSLFFESCL